MLFGRDVSTMTASQLRTACGPKFGLNVLPDDRTRQSLLQALDDHFQRFDGKAIRVYPDCSVEGLEFIASSGVSLGGVLVAMMAPIELKLHMNARGMTDASMEPGQCQMTLIELAHIERRLNITSGPCPALCPNGVPDQTSQVTASMTQEAEENERSERDVWVVGRKLASTVTSGLASGRIYGQMAADLQLSAAPVLRKYVAHPEPTLAAKGVLIGRLIEVIQEVTSQPHTQSLQTADASGLADCEQTRTLAHHSSKTSALRAIQKRMVEHVVSGHADTAASELQDAEDTYSGMPSTIAESMPPGELLSGLQDLQAKPDDSVEGRLPVPPRGEDEPPSHISLKTATVDAMLRKAAAKKSAAGPDGVTYEHLLALTEDDAPQFNAVGLKQIFEDIANGHLHPALHDWLRGARLVAIPKQSDEGRMRIRPIAIGGVIQRGSAKLALQASAKTLKGHIGDTDFSIGVRDGAAAATHVVQSCIDGLGADYVTLQLDISNAYNSRSRTAILEALFSRPSLRPLYRIAHLLYAEPGALAATQLRLWGEQGECTIPTLQSEQGVRQGCPLSSALFALSLTDVCNDATRGVCGEPVTEGGPSTQPVLTRYQDDISVTGTVAVVGSVARRLVASTACGGKWSEMALNLSKSSLNFHPDNEAAAALACELSIPANTSGGFKLLGVAVGHDDECELGGIRQDSSSP